MKETLPPSALKEPFVLQSDYVQGGVTGIDYEEVNPKGDWTPWLPTKEPQKYKFDTNECSTISVTKCLEIQFNFLRNQFSIEALQWFTVNGYIDENGSFNFSERHLGIEAGTSVNGNSMNRVWEIVRKVGLLPQKDLSYSMEQSNKFLTQYDMCEDYYNPDLITDLMRVKAKQIFRWVTIQFEWVGANAKKTTPFEAIVKALKQAPLQIGTPVCPNWNSGNLQPCGKTSVDHATTVYAWTLSSYKDFDHYSPYLKILSLDYFIPYVMKGVLTINKPAEPYVELSVLMQFINLLKQIGAWTVKAVKGLR